MTLARRLQTHDQQSWFSNVEPGNRSVLPSRVENEQCLQRLIARAHWDILMQCHGQLWRPEDSLRHVQPMKSIAQQTRYQTSRPLPYYSVFASDTLFHAVILTFDPMTLTFHLWPWTFVAHRLWRNETLYQLGKQSSNSRRVIAISVFDLMTLNIVLRVALGSGIIFTKFDLRQLICAWIITFFGADTLCHAVTLTFNPLTLKVRGTSSITWSKSVRNLSRNRAIPAELLIILRIFVHFMSRCNTDLWLLDLELLQHF